MELLVVGLLIFLGVHSVAIVAPRWRDAQRARMGEGPWKGLFALASALGLGLIVYGYGVARHAPVVLYTPPIWGRHLAALLLLPVFPLVLSTYLPGRIKSAAKHPTLLATKLWALAHLLANGNLADVLLFGGFLAWAVADRIAAKRRAVARVLPGAQPAPMNDAIALVGGLVLYALFVVWAHRWIIGVAPFPGLSSRG
ncbi:MAG: NnrU family protein [Burkholderiaceae bacterium]